MDSVQSTQGQSDDDMVFLMERRRHDPELKSEIDTMKDVRQICAQTITNLLKRENCEGDIYLLRGFLDVLTYTLDNLPTDEADFRRELSGIASPPVVERCAHFLGFKDGVLSASVIKLLTYCLAENKHEVSCQAYKVLRELPPHLAEVLTYAASRD
jgi:hypothetical protein